MDRDMTRLLTALLLVLVVACTGDKAKELLETAEFEERQMNIPHAKQLYEEVIRLYPSSQEADKARARLASLSRSLTGNRFGGHGTNAFVVC